MALRSAAGVITSLGRGPCFVSFTARSPVASAQRMRSAWVAGIAALPGSESPSASITHAMVLAVPITMQVPTDGARRPLITSISSASSAPAR